jgi:hypothetical protein
MYNAHIQLHIEHKYKYSRAHERVHVEKYSDAHEQLQVQNYNRAYGEILVQKHMYSSAHE